MRKFICHENLLVRFAGLYLLGLLLFLLAWNLGYFLLPEAALRGSSVAAKAAGEQVSGSLYGELSRIFLVNLILGSIIIGFNFAIRINRVPLGYMIPLVWFILYGLTLGSNSFTIAMDQRMAPSLEVIGRSGLYEMAAYTLLAAATFSISRFEIKQIFRSNPEKNTDKKTLNYRNYLAFALALIILLLAALRESMMLQNLTSR